MHSELGLFPQILSENYEHISSNIVESYLQLKYFVTLGATMKLVRI